MLYLENITLFNFKNYTHSSFTFDKKFNYIIGLNGTGKTNLLDAIHYLCLTKSVLFNADNYSIRHHELFFLIKGTFRKNDNPYEVFCNLEKHKKTLKVNDKTHKRFIDHIGLFPCVMVLPNDTNLIQNSGKERRRFVDIILCQTNKTYFQKLINYNYILRQRNQALKTFHDHPDKTLILTLDDLLLPLAQHIFKYRQTFIDHFKTLVQYYYNYLAPSKEIIDLQYKSDLSEPDFEDIFKKNFEKDLMLTRTFRGTHKDDFLFYLNDKPLKYYGSQGQQKTYILALKLAHHQFIFEKKTIQPLLLLDDIFDKIDDYRYTKLLELIEDLGQVFITDINNKWNKNCRRYTIKL